MRLVLVVEILFRSGFQQARVDIAAPPVNFACSRMLRMRLKLAASGSKSGVDAKVLDAHQARFQIHQVAPTRPPWRRSLRRT